MNQEGEKGIPVMEEEVRPLLSGVSEQEREEWLLYVETWLRSCGLLRMYASENRVSYTNHTRDRAVDVSGTREKPFWTSRRADTVYMK